jgi:hypothetical protein
MFYVDYDGKKIYFITIINRLCVYGILDTLHKRIFIYVFDIVKESL